MIRKYETTFENNQRIQFYCKTFIVNFIGMFPFVEQYFLFLKLNQKCVNSFNFLNQSIIRIAILWWHYQWYFEYFHALVSLLFINFKIVAVNPSLRFFQHMISLQVPNLVHNNVPIFFIYISHKLWTQFESSSKWYFAKIYKVIDIQMGW
jgi:hypothetical protein